MLDLYKILCVGLNQRVFAVSLAGGNIILSTSDFKAAGLNSKLMRRHVSKDGTLKHSYIYAH